MPSSAAPAELRPFPRSWLFIPALRLGDWLASAIASEPDCVVIDLEDSVPEAKKAFALQLVSEGARDFGRTRAVLRTSGRGASVLRSELDVAHAIGASAVIFPKVGSASIVRTGAALASSPIPVIPLVETASGILRVQRIAAAHASVAALAFGAEDLAADVGARGPAREILLSHARSELVLAAAAHALPAIDSPWPMPHDRRGAIRAARRAAAMGFSGQFAIHPSQVEVINRAFTPTLGEYEEALEILRAHDAAEAAGTGAHRVGKMMVDAPIARAARRIVDRRLAYASAAAN